MCAQPLPPICILAGGLGHAAGRRGRDTPKPLLEVAGEPFLLHQLRLLAGYGARRVVLCVGYLGELIEQRDRPRRSSESRSPTATTVRAAIGTLGAIRQARRRSWATGSWSSTATPICGSTTRAAVRAWERSGLPAMMTVLRNEGRWDMSNVRLRRRRG